MASDFPDPVCRRCGKVKSAHKWANYADTAGFGDVVIICPTATFEPVGHVPPRAPHVRPDEGG